MKSTRIKIISGAILFTLFLSASFLSCTDEEELRPETITDAIQNDSRFTILRSVLMQGGMSDALRTGSFTFFAPNDDAFRKMSITDAGQVNTMTRDSLRSVLQYLILDGLHPASAFEFGNKKPLQTLGGNNLFVTRDETKFLVNMANVVQTDIQTDNGIIHVIDHVPSTSPLTIAQWIGANPSFSFLSALATRAAAENPALAVELLNENSSFTFFAPTNEAFIASGFTSIQDINEADPLGLISLLTQHILRNAYFSTELKTGAIGTIGNQQLLLAVNGKITVAGGQNSGTLPTITRSDILTKNGVIHVLDQVLLP
jgi:uncharacterized surface protein with fasciclin (FAS1) repeats